MRKIIGFLVLLLASNVAFAACEQTVAPGGNVATAVTNAVAGTEVCLNTGDHGTVTLNNIVKASYVTIKPTVPGSDTRISPRLSGNTAFIRFEGLRPSYTELHGCVNNIQIINNVWQPLASGIKVGENLNCGTNDKNILIEGNTFITVDEAWSEGLIGVVGVHGVTIRNNLFQGTIYEIADADGVQTGGQVNNLLIEGNIFRDIKQSACGPDPFLDPHCDSIQINSNGNATIRGNFFDDVSVTIQHHDATTPVIFEDNVIKNSEQFWLYSTPGNVNGSIVRHNTFYNQGLSVFGTTGSGVTDTTNLTMQDNIFVASVYPSICSGCTVSHNLGPSAFGTNFITGTPTFVGGSPASITTYAGFALAGGSIGIGNASDGQNRGIRVGPDTTAPTVVSTVPTTGATNISVANNLTVTFNETMNAATINSTNLVLTNTSTSAVIASTVTYAGNTATINPNANLANSTGYTLTIPSGGVQDAAGNAIGSAVTVTFTTVAAADTTPPTVSSTVPTSGATGVNPSANITATFSEALNSGTVTTTTASIKRTSDSAPVTSTVSYASNQITINPNADLAASTQYTGTLTTGIQDAAGNALASTYTWNFTTAAGGGFTEPVSPIARYNFEMDDFLGDSIGSHEGIPSVSYIPGAAIGKIGLGACFNGKDRLTAPMTPGLFSGAYSVSFWAKRSTESTSNQSLLVNESIKSLSISLYGRQVINLWQQKNISTNYNFSMAFNNARAGANFGIIAAGQYNHFVVTYASGVQKIYINGVQVASAKRTKQMISQFTQLQIGGGDRGSRFKGQIDALKIYNVALTQANVTALFNQTVN